MITLANIRRAIYNIGKRLDIVDKELDIIKERQDNTYNKGEVDLLLSNKANNSIYELIPTQAASDNLLADKNFVNSSVSTATATYRGCYNLVSDLSLTTQASHGQIETALATAVSGTPDNNDYAFVQIPADDLTPTEIFSVERYKFNGTLWSFEYTLNNSGFTAAQWAAVNSNITSGLVTKLNALSTNDLSTITKLFGMDSNGNFLNISTNALASVLGGSAFIMTGTVVLNSNVWHQIDAPWGSKYVSFGISEAWNTSSDFTNIPETGGHYYTTENYVSGQTVEIWGGRIYFNEKYIQLSQCGGFENNQYWKVTYTTLCVRTI